MINLRQIINAMPDGKSAHAVRQFNLAPKAAGQVPSVKALAEDLGFAVERCKLPVGIAGRLVQDAFAENGYRIEVNDREAIQRQRWTVLHEIGHFFLHSNHTDPFAQVKFRDRRDPFYLEHEIVEEREADEFAAALLFDHGALEAARSLLGKDEVQLASHFGVSTQVIRIALKRY